MYFANRGDFKLSSVFCLSKYIYLQLSQDIITSGNALYIANCNLGRYRFRFPQILHEARGIFRFRNIPLCIFCCKMQ